MDDTAEREATTASREAVLVNDTSERSTFSAVRATTKLRNALRLNSAFSLVTGLEGMIFAGWLADQLGLGTNGALYVRLVSLGLVGFAMLVFFEAGRSATRVLASTRQIAAADLLWVGATVALVALGVFSTTGVVIVGVLALIVLDVALLQLRQRSLVCKAFRAASVSAAEVGTTEALLRTKPVAVSSDKLWPEVINRAPDNHYALEMMQGSWATTPGVNSDSELALAFAFRPKAGIAGRLMAAGLHVAFGPILRHIVRGSTKAATS